MKDFQNGTTRLLFSTSCYCFGSCSTKNQTVSQVRHHRSRLDSLAWVNIFYVPVVHTCWWVLGEKKECWVFSPTNPQWNKGNSTVHNWGCPAIPGFRSCGPVDPKVPATSIHRGIRNTLRCFCELLGVSSQSVCGTIRNKVYLGVVADQLTMFGEKMRYFFRGSNVKSIVCTAQALKLLSQSCSIASILKALLAHNIEPNEPSVIRIKVNDQEFAKRHFPMPRKLTPATLQGPWSAMQAMQESQFQWICGQVSMPQVTPSPS